MKLQLSHEKFELRVVLKLLNYLLLCGIDIIIVATRNELLLQ